MFASNKVAPTPVPTRGSSNNEHRIFEGIPLLKMGERKDEEDEEDEEIGLARVKSSNGLDLAKGLFLRAERSAKTGNMCRQDGNQTKQVHAKKNSSQHPKEEEEEEEEWGEAYLTKDVWLGEELLLVGGWREQRGRRWKALNWDRRRRKRRKKERIEIENNLRAYEYREDEEEWDQEPHGAKGGSPRCKGRENENVEYLHLSEREFHQRLAQGSLRRAADGQWERGWWWDQRENGCSSRQLRRE